MIRHINRLMESEEFEHIQARIAPANVARGAGEICRICTKSIVLCKTPRNPWQEKKKKFRSPHQVLVRERDFSASILTNAHWG